MTNPTVREPTKAELEAANCWKPDTDKAPGDPETSAFKKAARLHQARWRERNGHPEGTEPITDGDDLGSRLPLDYAQDSGANFISDAVRAAVDDRLASPQPDQMLKEDRLWADLLSSMPMCFNLFGSLDSPQARKNAAATWWPDFVADDAAGVDVVLEWSPGRTDPAYLANRSAFDAAFLVDLPDDRQDVVGIETKYHEHPTTPTRPNSLARYREVAAASGVFVDGAEDALIETPLGQIWADHLLALSMAQHSSGHWRRARFVLVFPDANPSWRRLASEYRTLLSEDPSSSEATFATATLDELLEAGVHAPADASALVERYRCWETAGDS